LCFFDGEEAFGPWSETDGLYGSRAFVEHLRRNGELATVRAMINLDMIGDCYLGIKRERFAPGWLTRVIWDTARELDCAPYFLPFAQDVGDDHVPFRQAGIPAVDVIDFLYGQTDADHQRTWHTANDTLDHVCAASLQVVGDVIYHALPKLDASLDKGP
jgi:Zn-dependent M28 family amino/carboxypeptidase